MSIATQRSILATLGLLLLSTVGHAQWPIRYNGASNGIDEAYAIARDRFGNTYVCGKSWAGSTFKYDALVDSYDANGNRRSNWPQSYDAGQSGDDIATSIEVTWDGSVIVAGTSYGGTTSGFDYFVYKWDSGGNRVWPNSGSAGTNAVYHNGAIRTTQSSGATQTP